MNQGLLLGSLDTYKRNFNLGHLQYVGMAKPEPLNDRYLGDK